MSRRHWHRVIDDIDSQGVDQQTVQVLTDLFENLMGSIIVTSARMARFDLGDFYSARILRGFCCKVRSFSPESATQSRY